MPTQGIVYESIPRIDAEVVRGFREMGVASVHEAMARAGLMNPRIRPLQPGFKASGQAITCACHAGDNLTLHRAFLTCRPGDVLVVTIDGHDGSAIWGELVTVSAQAIGLSAAVIDGAVRDAALIRRLGFPVWSRWIGAGGTVKKSMGAVNVPIVAGGTIVNPGDVVVADDDGVAVVPWAEAATILDSAVTRDRKEDGVRERIGKGELLYNILGLDKVVDGLGVRVVPGTYLGSTPEPVAQTEVD